MKRSTFIKSLVTLPFAVKAVAEAQSSERLYIGNKWQPTSPVEGDMFYNTNGNTIYIYLNDKWRPMCSCNSVA
jgi:hypothetical protein